MKGTFAEALKSGLQSWVMPELLQTQRQGNNKSNTALKFPAVRNLGKENVIHFPSLLRQHKGLLFYP